MSTCRNHTCECEAPPGHAYCSGYCANVDLSETIPGYTNSKGQCACGHAHCHPSLRWAIARSPISVGSDEGAV